MDKSLSGLNKVRQLAGLSMRFDDKTPAPAPKAQPLDEGSSPGGIQNMYVVTDATPDSDLHDVLTFTDVNGLINIIRSSSPHQTFALFQESAKHYALKEAKIRIEAAQGGQEMEGTPVAEMEEPEMAGDDIDVDPEDKPSFDLMDTSEDPTGESCEECGCDPCKCEDREEASKDDLSESKDESSTAPGNTSVNAQNKVGSIFKSATWTGKDVPSTNMSDDGDSHQDAQSLYPMDAKRQTDSEENEEKITIPTTITTVLKSRVKELEDKLEEKWWHDEGTALMHGRAAHWMKEILKHLDGTKEGFKWAQIEYTKAMGPIQQLMPDDVRTWIARGGKAASLKSFMSHTTDRG